MPPRSLRTPRCRVTISAPSHQSDDRKSASSVKPGQNVFVSCANSPIAKRICLTYRSDITRGDNVIRAARRLSAYRPLRQRAYRQSSGGVAKGSASQVQRSRSLNGFMWRSATSCERGRPEHDRNRRLSPSRAGAGSPAWYLGERLDLDEHVGTG